jgi:hypothetical protein
MGSGSVSAVVTSSPGAREGAPALFPFVDRTRARRALLNLIRRSLRFAARKRREGLPISAAFAEGQAAGYVMSASMFGIFSASEWARIDARAARVAHAKISRYDDRVKTSRLVDGEACPRCHLVL